MITRPFKVLIIDDSPSKVNEIQSFLLEASDSGVDIKISVAGSLSKAAQSFSLDNYDFIILDLMLPFIDDHPPEANAGLELLKQLRDRTSKHRHVPVLGLSAHLDEAGHAAGKFSYAGVVIVEFDKEGGWKNALKSVLDPAIASLPKISNVDFLIMTALEGERDGFGNTCAEVLSTHIVHGLSAQFVKVDDSHGVIVRTRQMGLAAAINDTGLAIRIFRPRVVAMSGICAGRSSQVSLGQLVLASSSWEYQAGKWARDGFQIAHYTIPMRPETKVKAEQVLGSEEFLNALEDSLPFKMARPVKRSKPLSAPFASGSAVIADESRLEHILVQHRKLAALDMEVFGVYFSCHESDSFVEHFFAVKCVVDLADQAKDDSLHEFGSTASARAVVAVVKSLLI